MLSMATMDAPATSQANPFDELRPVLRSEEDDIRKGIFSTALKRLRTITPEEKIEWCVAVHEASLPKAVGTAAGLKRAREAALAHAVPGDEAVVAVSTDVDGDATNTAVEAVKSPEEVLAEQVAAVRAFTPAEASEYVAAFMRAQLDKVVGGSLNNLSVAALRVLCLMLGIVTRARGKDPLYNTLASYYYTDCEKLGKRVRRDTFVKSLAQQDAEMLNRLLPPTKPHKAASSSSTVAATPSAASSSSAAGPRSSKARRENDENVLAHPLRPAHQPAQAAISVKGNAAPLPAKLVKGSAATAKPSRRATPPAAPQGDEDLEIDYGGRVFGRAPTGPTTATQSTSAMDQSEADEPSTLCGVALERKVASIIQLYDPVTVDIIVKKLAQIGFRPPTASRVVEDILRTFHQKQLIFFDSGIAYMM